MNQAFFRVGYYGSPWLMFHEKPDETIEILLLSHGWQRSIGNMWTHPSTQAPPPGIPYEIEGLDQVGIPHCVGCAPV